MLPSNLTRVTAHTNPAANEKITVQTEEMVRYFARHPDEINRRLAELEREWDVERALETNAATLAVIGVSLGALVHRRFLILPAVVTAFLLQHALQGWCPPLPIMRKLGIRTQAEIDEERFALKALRGDFDDYYSGSLSEPEEHARAALRAARA